MNKIQMTTPLVEMDGDKMTRILWKPQTLLLFIVLLGGLLLSCTDEEETVPMPDGKVVPLELVGEKELPIFIIEKANQYPSSQVAKLYVFSGIWKDQVLYLLHHPLMSSFYYDLYDVEGNRLEYGSNAEVVQQTNNWKCIYII